MNNHQKKPVLQMPISGEYISILCSHFFGTREIASYPKPKQVSFDKRYPVWHISGNNSTNPRIPFEKTGCIGVRKGSV